MLRFSVTNTTGAEIAIKSIKVESSDPTNEFYAKASYSPHDFTTSEPKLSIRLSCSHNIAAGSNANFYMTTPGNTVSTASANLIITVEYDDTSKVFTVPGATNAFLQTPFEGGKRYYFDLSI